MVRMSIALRQAAGAAAVLTLFFAACSGDDDVGSSGPTTTTTVPSDPTASSGPGATTPTTHASDDQCTPTHGFTTEPVQIHAGSGDPVYLLDAGRHDAPECTDQLTFRLNGAAEVGYFVGYADGSDVRVEGGQQVVTAGDAALVVDVSAPIQGGPFDQTGHQPGVRFADSVGQALYPTSNPDGLVVIEEVRFAGEVEGGSGSVSSFAVGVDGRRPFAVSSFVDEDSSTRVIVVRVAH